MVDQAAGNDSRKASHGSYRKINTPTQDDERHPHRQNGVDRDMFHQNREIARR